MYTSAARLAPVYLMGWIYCLVPKLATKTVCPTFSTVRSLNLTNIKVVQNLNWATGGEVLQLWLSVRAAAGMPVEQSRGVLLCTQP